MKFLSLFSGIGAFEKALYNLGIPFDLVGFSEIDKYAVKSYCAIHGTPESLNLGDITKIDEKSLPKDIDLITYGFPCQDISLAGNQQGLFNNDGTRTRSGLFFEALRIIEATQPKIAIAENVKNLVGKRFKAQFQIVLASLEAAGYINYWAVLNSKDFGVPQNRERVLIVSIRKDIDTGAFKFPEGFPLELRLKDMLENGVDEKYYLSDKMKDYLANITEKNKARGNGNIYVPTDIDGVSKTITTKEGSRVKDNFIEEPTVKQICNLMPGKNRANPNQGRLYDKEGFSPTLGAMQGGNRQPFILEDSKKLYVSDKGKKYILNPKRGMCTDINADVAQTLTAKGQSNWTGSFVSPDIEKIEKSSTIGSTAPTKIHLKDGTSITSNDDLSQIRIRRLTPKECFRLMGFSDEDFVKAEAVNSNTQLYKQAGNSIVVDVLEHIFTALKAVTPDVG